MRMLIQSRDWHSDVYSLPVRKSDSVFLGTVEDVRARLTQNRKAVYSEIQIRVDEIMKSDDPENVRPGKSIIAQREGGVVRYPSGALVWHRVAHQGMPKVG